MDTIPEKVVVRFLQRTRTPGFGAQNFADGAVADGLCVLAVTERRRAEHGHAGFLRETKDFDDVFQRTRHRFVDIESFAGFDDRSGLFKVRPAIHALQHDGVHVPAQFLDVVIEGYAILLAQFFGVTIDTRPARFDVRAAAFECGDDLRAGDMVGNLGIVEQGGEGRDVRGVQPDQADAQFVSSIRSESHDEYDRKQEL